MKKRTQANPGKPRTAKGGKKPVSRAKTKLGPRASPAQPATNAPLSRVPFSHVEKVMFPKAGVTKGELIEYYLKVSDKLLPHLRGRPMTLERMPDGIGPGKPRFWQKNTPEHYPSWVPRVELPTEDGKRVRYALVNDVDTLAYLVNQGTITFHPFLSRVDDLDRPDFVLFDLDPGGATFGDVVKIARTLQDVLNGQGLASFPKTSGKSGLHVLTPWTEAGGYDEARAWAMKTALEVIERLPKLATVERLKNERAGRVYIDVIQNARGHHVVPPYVLRPTPQAAVSTPLQWKEVTPKLDPARFTIRSAPRRFASRADPMATLTGT